MGFNTLLDLDHDNATDDFQAPYRSVLSRPRSGGFLGDCGKRVAGFTDDAAQLRG
jgi:hypothetical protein